MKTLQNPPPRPAISQPEKRPTPVELAKAWDKIASETMPYLRHKENRMATFP